jgi:hypothetical protein
LVLSGNGVDERLLDDEQVPVRAWVDIREPRKFAVNVAEVEVRDRREGSEGVAAGLDQVAQGVCAQGDHLVSLALRCSSDG